MMQTKFDWKTVAIFALSALAIACSEKTEPAEVVISLQDSATSLSSATILVNYSQASAKPVIKGGQPECASIVPHVKARFSDDGQGQLTISTSSEQGFSAPLDIAVCRMQPDSPDVAPASISARLRISLVAATDTAGETLDAEKLAQAKTGTRRSRQAANGIEPAPRRNETRRERVRDGSRPAPPAEDLAGDVPADERIARAPAPAGEPAQRREGERLGLIPDRPSQSNRDAAAPGRAPAQDDRDSERPRSDGKADANEDSDTDRAAVAYSVTVGVTNHPGVLGALQFDIIFRGDAGGFAGAAGSAKCFSEIPAALSTFNDKGKGTLSGALIDLEGIQTPGAIATCTFKSRSAVGPSDFSVTVVDASPPDTGKSLPEFPQMAVIDLRAAK